PVLPEPVSPLITHLLLAGVQLLDPSAYQQALLNPANDIRCIREEPDECARDAHCRGKKKCCHFFCAMRCVDPEKGKRHS
uniref:WAP domain-containing protein n=1 Tax=Chrysemys picta bellii TaxID=8478 RepID=A0A8C3HX64_CHRPI